MPDYSPHLAWLDTQQARMLRLVTDWSNINSGTDNLPGLAKIFSELDREFSILAGQSARVPLSPYRRINPKADPIESHLGDALHIRKRPDSPLRVLLSIHMDTVYSADHPFQRVTRLDENTLNGPGVVDAKGGLCVMLLALEALERSPFAQRIGWEVLLNPDEEIGSPGSVHLLRECAGRNQLGLVYEPAFADGALVGQRKGSGSFDAIIRGRSAHAGRDFHAGRSALAAAAALITALDSLNHPSNETTLNIGRIDGGGPSNIVPDLAIVRFNIRVPHRDAQQKVESELARIVADINQRDGIRVELLGGFLSPPKVMDAVTTGLYENLAACGRDLGLTLTWRSSGGVSDGNKLAAAGLPVIDTLGPRGGHLHSDKEYLLIDSLTERAKLSALLLMKLATGEIVVPPLVKPAASP